MRSSPTCEPVLALDAGELASRLADLTAERRRYTLRALPAHLSQAGQAVRLRQLLTAFDFLQVKVVELGPQALLEDYDLPRGPDDNGVLPAVQQAIRLAAHVVAAAPTQLAGQLLARLPRDGAPELSGLLVQTREWRGAPWLRPLRPELAAAGSPLLRTIPCQDGEVDRLALLPDGQRIVSASERS
ncbi:MAG: hypothetical protein JOZ81_17335 [Chloroflexi bacterium]|nr:hypothetical protein [Chloroflexota bacterium]